MVYITRLTIFALLFLLIYLGMITSAKGRPRDSVTPTTELVNEVQKQKSPTKDDSQSARLFAYGPYVLPRYPRLGYGMGMGRMMGYGMYGLRLRCGPFGFGYGGLYG